MCFGKVLDGLYVFLEKLLRIPIISWFQHDTFVPKVGYYAVNDKVILVWILML